MRPDDEEFLNDLAESVVASFDSKVHITWNFEGEEVTGRFVVKGTQITVFFVNIDKTWQVGFEITGPKKAPAEAAYTSFPIFSGVFQTVQEFLEVRQPEKLIFVSKDEGFTHLYNAYLDKHKAALQSMGYQILRTQTSPFTEFVLSKTTPSEWRGG